VVAPVTPVGPLTPVGPVALLAVLLELLDEPQPATISAAVAANAVSQVLPEERGKFIESLSVA
jgi:hypothetical protein